MPLVTRERKSPGLVRPAAGIRQSHEITVAASASRKQQIAAATGVPTRLAAAPPLRRSGQAARLPTTPFAPVR